MTNSIHLHPHLAPSPFRGLARAGAASSPLVAQVARLQGEVRRLETALRMRDHATALVLHELRQPLSVLVMAATYLGKSAGGSQKVCVDRLRTAALRLDGLVADLSDTSFLESGRFALQLKSTDVTHVVAASVARLGSEAVISVEGDIPFVEVDPRRVEQVLTNLLSNAQKYGSQGTPPRVSIARREGVVVVTVLNDGPGLAWDERIKVFEPYYRGRERRLEATGLGLGLYICKKLVEEHGGSIWTDGDALHTRFSFSLPIPEEVRRTSETRIVAQSPSDVPRERSG
jgi:two-component system sensor histidine kinase KdpD